MSIDSVEDLLEMQHIGRIVALTLAEMRRQLCPGITTAELDALGGAVLERHGARSAPQLLYRYPGITCISINEEVAHGIPGKHVVKAGDLVNIDVSAELHGYFADAGMTVPVPPVSAENDALCRNAERALMEGIAVASAGRPVNTIGRAVEAVAARSGLSIIRNLGGHGVGRHLHEDPHFIANFYDRTDTRELTDGLVITIEPFLCRGAQHARQEADGWTLKTPPGCFCAQYEHTILITRGQPEILTKV